jgi:branched-chain amino acid transport system ATP-binding protein
LRGIDIEVSSGEIVCLLGSNGAGKTTTLMTVSGILRPDKGDIIFEGESLTAMPPSEIVRKGICHVPEGRRIFPKLTVHDNLEMGAYSAPSSDLNRNFEKVFAIFPILKERARQMGGTLSGGEQQMLAIGRSLMSNPRMLLLDEPSLGLAPIMVSRIFKIIQDINREGITVLLVEQNARAALSQGVCARNRYDTTQRYRRGTARQRGCQKGLFGSLIFIFADMCLLLLPKK